MLGSDELRSLGENYWVALDVGLSDESLLALAKRLGQPVSSRIGGPQIAVLKPKETNAGAVPTFSSTYGLGRFPLHTDSAHWPVPARFIILRDVGVSHDRPTLVMRCEEFVSAFPGDTAKRAVWKVAGPRGSFVCSTVSRICGKRMLRFDPLCMQPVNVAAIEATRALGQKEIVSTIVRWKKGMTLVIDNWNAVHGRGQASCDDHHSRALQRVLVFDSNALPLFPHVLAT